MEIKILSYNIQSWDVTERRTKGIVELIKRHNPDVICLQEVTIFWYSFLRKQLKDIYTFTGRDRFYGNKTERKSHFERNCVLFKKNRFKPVKCRTYWLGPDIYNPSRFEGAVLNRVFTTAILKDFKTNKVIQFVSTHFDDRFQEIRAKQGEILAEYAKKQETPLVIAGDFNSEPPEGAYKSVSAILNDVGKEFKKEEITYHAYNKYPQLRIDCVFTNKKVKALDFNIIKDEYEGLPPSDHYPLESKISIN